MRTRFKKNADPLKIMRTRFKNNADRLKIMRTRFKNNADRLKIMRTLARVRILVRGPARQPLHPETSISDNNLPILSSRIFVIIMHILRLGKKFIVIFRENAYGSLIVFIRFWLSIRWSESLFHPDFA